MKTKKITKKKTTKKVTAKNCENPEHVVMRLFEAMGSKSSCCMQQDAHYIIYLIGSLIINNNGLPAFKKLIQTVITENKIENI